MNDTRWKKDQPQVSWPFVYTLALLGVGFAAFGLLYAAGRLLCAG